MTHPDRPHRRPAISPDQPSLQPAELRDDQTGLSALAAGARPGAVVNGLAAREVYLLQQTLGNRATGNLMAARQPAAGARGLIQRGGSRPDFEDADAVAPNDPRITGVNFGDRPPARVMGGTGQGDHTLSFTVFEWGVYNAVHNQTFWGGVYQLSQLTQKLTEYPGFRMGYAGDVNLRVAQGRAIIDAAGDINGGRRSVSPINQPQVLGELIDQYLAIRNGLHLTARAKTPGANTHDRQGGQGLQIFAPAHALNGDGTLQAADVNTIITYIDQVIDFHTPKGEFKRPDVAGKTIYQALLSIFHSYPTQLPPAWHDQIFAAYRTFFLAKFNGELQWDASKRDTFWESMTGA